ncbi:hypothetical protein GGX14DRAFT_398968 [Mycena pura]|uniref:Uncharacterized protein n=1 Tax=Mycena pura TaxID=153505 RepID=A0AAD6YB50_9AGAR|nr:hypothetical protein GGX14DRAFT_398968 [Mycena pura]
MHVADCLARRWGEKRVGREAAARIAGRAAGRRQRGAGGAACTAQAAYNARACWYKHGGACSAKRGCVADARCVLEGYPGSRRGERGLTLADDGIGWGDTEDDAEDGNAMDAVLTRASVHTVEEEDGADTTTDGGGWGRGGHGCCAHGRGCNSDGRRRGGRKRSRKRGGCGTAGMNGDADETWCTQDYRLSCGGTSATPHSRVPESRRPWGLAAARAGAVGKEGRNGLSSAFDWTRKLAASTPVRSTSVGDTTGLPPPSRRLVYRVSAATKGQVVIEDGTLCKDYSTAPARKASERKAFVGGPQVTTENTLVLRQAGTHTPESALGRCWHQPQLNPGHWHGGGGLMPVNTQRRAVGGTREQRGGVMHARAVGGVSRRGCGGAGAGSGWRAGLAAGGKRRAARGGGGARGSGHTDEKSPDTQNAYPRGGRRRHFLILGAAGGGRGAAAAPNRGGKRAPLWRHLLSQGGRAAETQFYGVPPGARLAIQRVVRISDEQNGVMKERTAALPIHGTFQYEIDYCWCNWSTSESSAPESSRISRSSSLPFQYKAINKAARMVKIIFIELSFQWLGAAKFLPPQAPVGASLAALAPLSPCPLRGRRWQRKKEAVARDGMTHKDTTPGFSPSAVSGLSALRSKRSCLVPVAACWNSWGSEQALPAAKGGTKNFYSSLAIVWLCFATAITPITAIIHIRSYAEREVPRDAVPKGRRDTVRGGVGRQMMGAVLRGDGTQRKGYEYLLLPRGAMSDVWRHPARHSAADPPPTARPPAADPPAARLSRCPPPQPSVFWSPVWRDRQGQEGGRQRAGGVFAGGTAGREACSGQQRWDGQRAAAIGGGHRVICGRRRAGRGTASIFISVDIGLPVMADHK